MFLSWLYFLKELNKYHNNVPNLVQRVQCGLIDITLLFQWETYFSFTYNVSLITKEK